METSKKTNLLLIIVAMLLLLNIVVTFYTNYRPYQIGMLRDSDCLRLNVYTGEIKYFTVAVVNGRDTVLTQEK